MSHPNPAGSGPPPPSRDALRDFQKRYGLTNKVTAELLGCSLPTIQKWRNGAFSPPPAVTRLIALLDALAGGKRDALHRLSNSMKGSCHPAQTSQPRELLADAIKEISAREPPPDAPVPHFPHPIFAQHPFNTLSPPRSYQTAAGPDAPSTIQYLIEETGLCLGAERGYLLQLLEAESVLSNTHEWCRRGIPSQKQALQRVPRNAAQWLLQELEKTDESLLIDPTARDPHAEGQNLFFPDSAAMLAVVPIRLGSTPVGFLGFDLPAGQKLPAAWMNNILKLARHAIASLLTFDYQNHGHLTAEQELLRTLKSADLFFWRWDLKSSRIWIDEAFFALLDKPPPGRPLEVTQWMELVHPEDRERLRSAARSCLRETGTALKGTYRMLRSNGSSICVLIRSTDLVRDKEHEPVSISGSLLDTTEERAKEQSLERSLHDAELANVSRMRFLASVSHELMTPLNGILGMSQLLQESALLPEHVEMAGTIINSGRSLQGLIEDILLFSSLDAGDAKLDPEPCDPRELLVVWEQAFRQRALEKGLGLSLQVDPNMPRNLILDCSHLMHIATHLIDNALKFTAQGEIHVHLSGKPLGTSRFNLIIEVSDTGIGIDKEQRALIFEPFCQGDGSSTRRYEGLGIGLSIVQKLVRIMHGTVHITNASSSGTCVKVKLPVDTEEPARSESGDEEPDPAVALLIDDDPINQRLTERLLSKIGCRTAVAESGEEALLWLRQNRPPFVLLEMHLPAMDGWTFLAEYQATCEHHARAPVFVIGAIGKLSTHKRQNLLQSDAIEGILTKPYALKELRTAVEPLLRSHRVHPGNSR